MSIQHKLASIALFALACTDPGVIGERDAGVPCMPTAQTESSCSDGVDDDCDGYADCLDNECGGQTCGSNGETCVAGGCLCPTCPLPELPEIANVRADMRGNTAVIDFEPFAGARDYRVYPLPAEGAWMVDAEGVLVVENAIYRCGGDRPLEARADSKVGDHERSLAGNLNGYERTEAESILGHVYLVPGPGREPVYRMGDPQGKGGFIWDYNVQPASEYSSADYVVGSEARDRLVVAGWRDDGVAFYVPTAGDRPIYRLQYAPQDYATSSTLYFTDGPEHAARSNEDPAGVVSLEERFRVFSSEQPGTVALHRVTYSFTNVFDVIAAGEARFQRILEQGNQPIWSVTWPGLTAETTLVVEALDQGCPFSNGYIGAMHNEPDEHNPYGCITLDEGRNATTGEVFINGQHDPANRPRPIARAYITVSPEPPPNMAYYETFDEPWAPLSTDTLDGINTHIRRNDRFITEFAGCTLNDTVGPALGQLVIGGGDGGSSCNMSVIPRNLPVHISDDAYLHVRMSTEIPSTGRRYPQILITTTPTAEPGSQPHSYDEPVRNRLGPLPFADDYIPGSGDYHTIIVQPFASNHELQLEFCNRRGWGVSAQCPRANVYGYHGNDYTEEWVEPWRPVPVLGDLAGHDRPVQFDVYASTDRVFVFVDERPAGCAVLPAGQMPDGPVTVIFGSVIYHGAIDESVVPEDSPHQYMRRYQPDFYLRRIDDIGIDQDVARPIWDETVLPCATRWFGADE